MPVKSCLGETDTGALVTLSLKYENSFLFKSISINIQSSLSIFPLLTVPGLQGSCFPLLQDSVRTGSMIIMLRNK